VVGAGFSGTLTAVQVLRAGAEGGWRVVLLERRSRFGRGAAYHSWDDNLLLNVPAGNMSAWPERPTDFVDFCRNIDPAFNAGSFVSRRIYGDYLERTLEIEERASRSVLVRRPGEVVSVVRPGPTEEFVLTLADGATIAAERVVLAFGHSAPRTPTQFLPLGAADGYLGNPTDFDALDRIEPTHPVAILGCGHTGIDVLFRLTSGSDRRRIFLVSRRGLLPHGHRITPRAPALPPELPAYLQGLPDSLRAHLRAVRAEAERCVARGEDWRDVVNGLRPHLPAIWERLPKAEKRRFLDRVVPYWDIHRHRLAPAAFLRLQQMLQSGQVVVLAGRISRVETARGQTRNSALRLDVEPRGGGAVRSLEVGAVVNCTGPNYDLGSLQTPLLVQLREAGLLTADPMRIGVSVDDHYRPLDPNGLPTRGLHYIGPMLRARFWEATAVPELRVHAARLASIILGPTLPYSDS
jgi:uncharacterized NAD(P)/FAD-binding protein YdhS